VTLINAPRGFGGILHVMEFPWDAAGAPRDGIGSTDARLIGQWPGLMFDNTRDYISWGIWAAADKFPQELRELDGPALLALTQRLTAKWHPNWRRLLAGSDPGSVFRVMIRTSVPLAAWPPSNVTLLGDAVHTMTPGRGVGANTALRDAALLVKAFTAVRDGRRPLLEAIGAYEARMRDYGYEAVLRSRQDMDGHGLIHRPYLGRLLLAGQRMMLRTVSAVPPLKRKMQQAIENFRGAERPEETI
jgi:2-polyprenyl-6-methoxyphenol hydroxylase-like FAD-dependent oxidoreductase